MMVFSLVIAFIFVVLCNAQHPCETQCGNATYGPVNEGIDFVDLRQQYNTTGNITNPNKGVASQSVTYGGYEFWFINENNKQLFAHNVEYYLPKYGCWCAWGMTGKCAECVAPQCIAGTCVESSVGYAFIKDKLYCFMVSITETEFKNNVTANIKTGDQIWQQVLQQRNTKYCFDTQYFETNC
eukprot:95256_1